MKKKSLLLAIAAMSMAAVGVGTVGTFAWYQTTQQGSVSGASAVNGTLTAENPVADVTNLYAKFTAELSEDEVALTTSDGYSFGIANGGLVPADENATKYGELTLQFEGWYTDSSCTAAALPAQYANLDDSYTITFKANTSGRVRITATDPSSTTFATAFANSLGKTNLSMTGSAAVTTSGGVTGAPSLYYSLAGQVLSSADVAASAWAEGRNVGEDMTKAEVIAHPNLSDESSSGVSGTITFVGTVVADNA